MRTQNGPRQLHKALKCAGIDCAERNHVGPPAYFKLRICFRRRNMFRTISMQQLEQLLDGERTFTLLDVREQKEYEAGHLLGAVNCLMNSWMKWRQRSQKTVLWSSTAPTEVRAARGERTRGTGYDAVNALGGLHYYRGKYYVGCGSKSSGRKESDDLAG